MIHTVLLTNNPEKQVNNTKTNFPDTIKVMKMNIGCEEHQKTTEYQTIKNGRLKFSSWESGYTHGTETY